MVDGVVIEVGVLGHPKAGVTEREEPEVVGIPVVKGVIGAYDGDLMGFRPAEADETGGKRGVSVNHIVLVFAKLQELVVKGRDCEGVVGGPDCSDRAEPEGIGV